MTVMGQVQCSEAGDEEFKSAFVVCMYMKKALFPHSVLLFSVSEWSEWDKDATKMPKLKYITKLKIVTRT